MKTLRTWGREPYAVAVIHGGPGAPGEMAPVARELSVMTGVLEPFQTENSLEGQVAELSDVLTSHAACPVTLIGFSWGATLSFIVTARYPALVKKLVLVGAAPFEARYAEGIDALRFDRMTEEERIEAFGLIDRIADPATPDKNTPMARLGMLYSKVDTYDMLPHEDELLTFSEDINRRVWTEAAALRKSGALLEMGRSITCPVVAFHGDYDPHPAEGVREPLSRVLRNFRFIPLEKCGHEPWLERHARERFYTLLKQEVA